MEQTVKEQEFLLAPLEALITTRVEAAQRELFRDFLAHYFEMSSAGGLRQRSPEELFDAALEHFGFGRMRSAGVALLKLQPPRDIAGQGAAACATIQTCAPDMPFLFNSLLMAVRDTGVVVDWTVHPVLQLRRDAQGAISAVGDAASESSHAESWVHLEIGPLADAEAYVALEQALRAVLGDLQQVTTDYPAMLAQVRALAERLRQPPPTADVAEFTEGHDLLLWMADQHFTFLGYAETRTVTGEDGRSQLVAQPDVALGLSRPGLRLADTDALIAPKQELDKYVDSGRLVVVTKATSRSSIHQPEYLDVISVKQFREDGTIAGTVRLIGLFSSDVYADRPRTIPLIRRKAELVMRRSHLPEDSQAGKNLREILHFLPRDELFQSSEEELYQLCSGIRALRDRHQLKLFMRRDRYGRFYSFLIYLPRERYSRELRDRVAQELLEICGGQSLERNVEFLRGGHTRIHVIVRTPAGTTLTLTAAEIEQLLIVATRSWREQLRAAILRAPQADATLASRYAEAFPLSYAEQASPADAAEDVQYLARLSTQQTLLPRLIADTAALHLKLYAWDHPVALSDVLPTLENFGLRVLSQEPTEIRPKDAAVLWIQDFEIQATLPKRLPDGLVGRFEQAFSLAWSGQTENDGLNRLVLVAGLTARQVTCLRALSQYINQIGLPYGRSELEKLLADHPQIAGLFVRLFQSRFDPAMPEAQRQLDQVRDAQELDDELDAVTSLSADRVLRTFLSVIRAGLRTNFYQPAADGSPKPYVSIKLDPSKIPELPMPRPMFEVWVYAPNMEGIHLRGGRVARGGLRWSDRREDFRTEVLGLMKAQMVKNAVIVPVGAKGGFVVKNPVPASDREAWMAQGIACYKTLLRGLLDITDNRVGDAIVPPQNVLRLDADDPYLVVAADKGTASFSDIANGISADYGFWLGDAFASGGSVGYDHKKMGITAKGAWESVKRHFREAGRDIQNEPFTAVGIGDMSGDVFGNGMLLSPQTRLIAAFDHRHIFIDPAPDAAASFAERQRLFALPRSSWADYDSAKISAGGGVHARTLKSIRLSEEARSALGINVTTVTPIELIRAILKAPVDLLWNGGIGTYVKAQTQSHPEVGDRANDTIRINGRELRAKVVGEGGNLGFTQLGRIEYALAGGRINTDAIDNSGGVHSSDREVNIKIPLNQLMAAGQLDRATRDPLLYSMTDDIARFVLRDSYVQSACISLQEATAVQRLDEHANLIRMLERDGLLNRAIEFLPDDETLQERRTEARGLTRPELAVLVAYAKISLFDAALSGDMPDDASLESDLLDNFPPALVEHYREPLRHHRLKREIIATILANAVVNRMGIAFAHRMAEDHGVSRGEVLKAYVASHRIYRGDDYWIAIEALDNQLPSVQQYRLMQRTGGLLKHATGWMLGARLSAQFGLGELVSRYAVPVAEVEKLLPEILPPAYREDWERIVANLQRDGVPATLAARMADTQVLGSALDIADLALEARVPLTQAAGVYLHSGERLRMLWLLAAIVGLQVNGKWQAMARSNLRDDAYRIHRALAARILQCPGATAVEQLDSWIAAHEAQVRFALNRLQELQAAGGSDFLGLAVAVRELRKLQDL